MYETKTGLLFYVHLHTQAYFVGDSSSAVWNHICDAFVGKLGTEIMSVPHLQQYTHTLGRFCFQIFLSGTTRCGSLDHMPFGRNRVKVSQNLFVVIIER